MLRYIRSGQYRCQTTGTGVCGAAAKAAVTTETQPITCVDDRCM